MGNTLSLPISSKVVGRKGDPNYRVAVADMQGFRLDFEDAHLVELEARKDKEGTSALFGVFDGHCGRVAADFLQANLLSYIQKAPDLSDKSLQQAMLNLDAEFCTDENRRHDGSTALFALARYKTDKSKKPDDQKSTTIEITVANVGDCRCLLGRPDGSFEALTEDHKPSNPGERSRIVAAGGQVVMSRLDGQLALSRAVGDYSYKSNPSFNQTDQKLIALPDITHTVARPGDYLVLCCDGLFEKLSNQELMAFVHEALKTKENVDPADVVQGLLDYSLESGSTDNMSAMIVQFRDGAGYSRPDEFVAGPFYYGRHDNKFVETYFHDAARLGYQPGSPQLLCLALDSDLKRNETRQKLIADGFESQLLTVRNTEAQIQKELTENKMSAVDVARRLDLSKPQSQQYVASKTLRRTSNAQGSVVIATCTIPGVQHSQSHQAVAVVPNLAQDANSTFVALIDSQPRPSRLADRTQPQAVSANVRAQSDFLVQMLPQRINTLNNLSPAPAVAKDKAGIQSAAVERSLQSMFSAINEDLLAHLTSQTISASFNAETDAPGPSYVGFSLVSQLPSEPVASKALAKPLHFQVIAGNLGHAYVLHGKSTAEGEFGSLSSTFNPRSVSQMDRLEEAGMFSTNFEDLATSFMGSNALIRRFSAQLQKPFAHVLPHVAVAEAQEGDFIVICSHNLCASEDAPGDVDDMGVDGMTGNTQSPSVPSFFRRDRRPALEVQQKIARFVRDALFAARHAGTAPDAVQIAADLMDDLLPCRTNDLNASLVLILLSKEGTAAQQATASSPTASASDPSAMAVDDGPLVPIPATPSRNSEAKDLTTSMSFYAPPAAAPATVQSLPRVDKFFRPGPIWEHRNDPAYITQFLQHARDHAPELSLEEVIRRAYQADVRWLHSRQALVVKHREKELESLRAEHDAISALRNQEAERLPASQVTKTTSTASTVSVGSAASSPPADEAAQKKQKVHVKDT